MNTNLAIRQEVNIDEWKIMNEQSATLVKTGFLPASIKTAEQAMAVMLMGRELGLPPMQSLRGIHVILGTPAIKPELMLSLCINRIAGFKYGFKDCDNKSATFYCQRPSMNEPYISTFTLEDAKLAGLLSNQTWSKYPGNMLRWRAVGNALHVCAPDVLVGIYTPDEMGAVVDGDSGDIIDIPETVTVTASTVVLQPEGAAKSESAAVSQSKASAKSDRLIALNKLQQLVIKRTEVFGDMGDTVNRDVWNQFMQGIIGRACHANELLESEGRLLMIALLRQETSAPQE